ncbi:MAG: ATP-binding protein [Chitinophagales bacterium]
MKETKVFDQPLMTQEYSLSYKKNPAIQDLFLQLLKNYPDGSISIIDRNFNFIYTDGELYQQLKIDPAGLIGEKVFSIFPYSLHQKIKSELSEVFHGNIVSDFELSDCCLRPDSYAMEAFPLLEPNNSIDKVGIIISNITRLKKVEGDLLRALEKERELSELKSRFVSMASHEFRTPLSTILSSAYLLSKYAKTEDQAKREKHLERIISSVNTLTDTLNDFLSLGKIEEGKISVNPVEIDVCELINNIIEEIKPILKENQTIVYKHTGKGTVRMDKGLLRHIISNLLSNAIKFSNKNSEIEIRTKIDAEFILSVKDHGIGISVEDQEHLSERFFRGTNAANIQGTGLGLHIVYRYAELMNGKVDFRSQLDEGTEFTVIFKDQL